MIQPALAGSVREENWVGTGYVCLSWWGWSRWSVGVHGIGQKLLCKVVELVKTGSGCDWSKVCAAVGGIGQGHLWKWAEKCT